MSKPSKESATDILAFLVVECNMSLPYEIGSELTLDDPLYTALVNAVAKKRRLAAEGNAFLASCIYNASGRTVKDFVKPTDFLPKTMEDRIAEENSLLTNMMSVQMAHNESVKPLKTQPS